MSDERVGRSPCFAHSWRPRNPAGRRLKASGNEMVRYLQWRGPPGLGKARVGTAPAGGLHLVAGGFTRWWDWPRGVYFLHDFDYTPLVDYARSSR